MPTSRSNITDQDLDLLSAYRDGELPARNRADVERRLTDEPALRDALDQIEQTHALLHDLPRLRAPRDFTLDPAVYGRRSPAWWQRLIAPRALQFGGALGAAAAVILIVVGVFTNTAQETPLSTESQNQVAFQPTSTTEIAANIAAPTDADKSPSPQPVPATATIMGSPTAAPQIEAFSAAGAQDEASVPSEESLSASEGMPAQPEVGAAAPMPSDLTIQATPLPASEAPSGAVSSAALEADSAADNGTVFREGENAEEPAPAEALPQTTLTESAADAITLAEPVAQATELATELPAEAAKQPTPAPDSSTTPNWPVVGAGAGLLILSGIAIILGRKNSRHA
ncbi:anti-sigma factor family protein [Aggregatilinea lenta]|uniref:anti-sigma factor family protein n=1 Tax=Aggregatilinea lenta TaxID=913108 RepID=UPI000E5C4987|nr:hypothetical protein [Aggregatilinea lenta]